MVGRSLKQIVWARLRRDKVAMLCLLVLGFYFFMAIFGPTLLQAIGFPPPELNFDKTAIDPAKAGAPRGDFGGISWAHPFGVEWGTGRDLFSQMVWGLQISLIVATTATFLTVSLGTIIGIVAGYLGGWVDMIIGRLTDLTLAFPFILIILALSNVLTQRIQDLGVPPGNPSRIVYLIVVISLFGWPYLGRIVRGQVISIREREFVEAAVALGASRRRILFTEILPNLWAPIIVYTTLTLPAYISLEAALSFLGVGTIPPTITFGAILANSVNYFQRIPTYLFIPGTILAILVVAFNLFGDAVRDALDPRVTR